MKLFKDRDSAAVHRAHLDAVRRLDRAMIDAADAREKEERAQYMAFVRAGVTGDTVHFLGQRVKVSLEWLDGCPFTDDQLVKLLTAYASH